MRLEEAKKYLNDCGFILEDTETNDEEYDKLDNDWDRKWGNVSDKALDNLNKKIQNVRHKHLDLEDKVLKAQNYNIENLFYGLKKELKKTYKNVFLYEHDYDDIEKCQSGDYEFILQRKYKHNFILTVNYYDEDGVINVKLTNDEDDEITDDFSVSTIDKAINQIIDFVNFQVRGE